MVAFCRDKDSTILESAYVRRDEDGVFAISPLNLATQNHEEFGFDIREYAGTIRDRLDEALEQIVDRPDQFAKVNELADRWNVIADKRQGFFSESYRTKRYVDLVGAIEIGLNDDL
jgi:hypothetical protein